MKKAIIFLLVSVSLCNCSEKKETIVFETLPKAAFNSKPFDIPKDQIPESLKRAHDSCMGFSFDANALLLPGRDSVFIGSIVNRQTLKHVSTLNDLGLTMNQMISDLNIISKPCYEKRELHFPLKLMLGENFNLNFPNANESLNKEINDAISSSIETEMRTGSWMYLDVKYVLKKILDTTKESRPLRYRQNLLDSSNMVLTAAESISDVSFIINTEKDISEPLQALLKTKPSVSSPNSQVSMQLFYLKSNKFQMNFSGFFPVFGEFMKAELK